MYILILLIIVFSACKDRVRKTEQVESFFEPEPTSKGKYLRVLKYSPTGESINEDTQIYARINLVIDESTLESTTFYIEENDEQLDFAPLWDSRVRKIYFENVNLRPGKKYKVTITREVESKEGKNLENEFSWEFNVEKEQVRVEEPSSELIEQEDSIEPIEQDNSTQQSAKKKRSLDKPINKIETITLYMDNDRDGYVNIYDSIDIRKDTLTKKNGIYRYEKYIENKKMERDCDDEEVDINPSTHELCDGVDNNCNRQFDENCAVGEYNDIFVEGDTAYAATDYGLVIIDISDKKKPYIVSRFKLEKPANGIAKFGNHVYIANSNKGLAIIDLDKRHDFGYKPVYYNYWGANFWGVAIREGLDSSLYAFVAAGQEGILEINVTDLNDLYLVDDYPTNGLALGVSIQENFLLIADGPNGVLVYSMDELARYSARNPYLHYRTPDIAWKAHIQPYTNYAYIAIGDSNNTHLQELVENKKIDKMNGLVIVDLQNQDYKENPLYIDFYKTSVPSTGVFLSRGYVYITESYYGLEIRNVNLLNNPYAQDIRVLTNLFGLQGKYNKRWYSKFIPSIWPVDLNCYVSSFYGWRRNPTGGSRSGVHHGIDIANGIGTPIFATAKGTVIKVNDRGHRFLGKYLKIKHKDGVSTKYLHCNEILVDLWDEVEKGQIIATMGDTGKVTGPHIHYGVNKNGWRINPKFFIADFFSMPIKDGL